MNPRRAFLASMAALPAGLAAAMSRAADGASSPVTATSILNFIPVSQHAAIRSGRSAFDCAGSIRAALAATGGGPLHFPAGTYLVGSSVSYFAAPSNAAFGPGPWIVGDGIDRTIFDNRATDGPMFNFDSQADHARQFSGMLGVRLEGFTITSNQRSARSTALRLRTAYNARLFQLRIIHQGADGIRIPCLVGDNDGSNMVTLDQVRIENCGGWGIDSAGEPGHNETSFLRLVQVFVQACGTASTAALPPSGGMRHKGQIMSMDQCAFTINENVALFIPGQAGLAQTVDIVTTAFENNKRRHILCTGIAGFKARSIQFYNADNLQAQVACEFSGATHLVRMVQIDGVAVRATAGNDRIVAFRFSGVHLERNTCRIRNVNWENFDYPGQVRFDGVPFDAVPVAAELVATDGITLIYRSSRGRGNQTPMRLRGKRSTTGEWVAAKLPPNGLYVGNAGLAPETRYDVYLWDNDAVPSLELSRTPPVTDPDSGYAVKSGDATRFHVGSVTTDSAGRFATTGAGWHNPTPIPGSMPGRDNYIWTDRGGKLRLSSGVRPKADSDGRLIG